MGVVAGRDSSIVRQMPVVSVRGAGVKADSPRSGSAQPSLDVGEHTRILKCDCPEIDVGPWLGARAVTGRQAWLDAPPGRPRAEFGANPSEPHRARAACHTGNRSRRTVVPNDSELLKGGPGREDPNMTESLDSGFCLPHGSTRPRSDVYISEDEIP